MVTALGLALVLVLVTHDSSVARRAQCVGVMSNGRLSIRPDTRRNGPGLNYPERTAFVSRVT